MKTTVALALWMAISAHGQDAAGSPADASAGPNKTILQSAVMSLLQAIELLRAEKWKASKDVKAGTAEKAASIQRDLKETLPGLVAAADAAPTSLLAELALCRNVGALYDVALRVAVVAESAAPADQADALEKSLSGLEGSRRMLAERMQQMAAVDDAKMGDLQKQLNARPAVAAVCPPAAAAAPIAVAKRKKSVPRKAHTAVTKPTPPAVN